MRQATTILRVATSGRGFTEITREVARWQRASGIGEGLLSLLCRHTSASLLIQENAAPAVRGAIERYFARLAPESADYAHDDEGPDDMPSHIKMALTRSSETIPVHEGRLRLGTWQGLFLWEHRQAPHARELIVTVIGD